MKILIVYQHYWPETFRITDIAETLVSLGHSVTVLTGLPNYPSGYIFNDYKHGKNRVQEHNGVKIIRAKIIGRRRSLFFRILNYWSFPYFASKLIKRMDKDFDVVYLQMTSPIMMAKPGLKYGKKYKKKVIMYALDLWPESLLAGGIRKSSFIYNHYKKVSSKIYSQCDSILVSTKEHIDYIKKLPGCNKLKIDYLPQYAESIFEDGEFNSTDNGTIDLVFTGNVGKAQSLETIVRAAFLLKDDGTFKFHIVGDGIELENIKKLASEMNVHNIVFYGQKPLSEMPKYYKMADVMLVSLENRSYANLTIPGKIQTYMAAGKPVIGAISGSCHSLIVENEIGYACEAGNYKELTKIIKSLTVEDLKIMGNKAKEVYQSSFSKRLFFDKLLHNLKDLTDINK